MLRRRAARPLLALALVAAGCTGTDGVAADATLRPTGEPAAPSVSAGVSIAPSPPFDRTVLTLRDGRDEVQVAALVADEASERARGLMDRTSLDPGQGMVFRFDGDATARFVMRDTLVPLTVAFFAADGTFVSAVDMDPCRAEPCPTYAADGPYRTALEVPQGWLSTVGVGPGWRLVGG